MPKKSKWEETSMSLTDRIRSGWNAFMNKDPTFTYPTSATSYRPDRLRLSRGNERSIITAVMNRIAVDAAQCRVEHIKTDENGRYLEPMDSDLNECLTVSANEDQTGRSLIQDLVMSMLDEGCVALFPTDADFDPDETDSYKIYGLRTGKIIEWRPKSVKISAYDERDGKRKEIMISKRCCAIVENPFYAVMNEPNSTFQRLIRKLTLLDYVDEENGAGKLDLIIQLPYAIKTPARKAMAEQRRKDIEMQLAGSKFGIAYTDSTEHITQLNRSIENQLLSQIKDLKTMVYSQLSITEEILNGTADETTMNNYYNRTIEPIMSAIVDELKRKFLTRTARTRHQSIQFFREPFKLLPTSQLAELADKFTRNEIMTSNEIRQVAGLKPSKDPHADELRNSNLSAPKDVERVDVDGNIVKDSGNENTKKEEKT